MPSKISQSRDIASQGAKRVIFGDAAVTTGKKSWSLFRSDSRKAENKQQFAKFLDVLKQDPKYKDIEKLAKTAFDAELASVKDSGVPLSSKLMRKVYAKADDLVAKHQNKLDTRSFELMKHAEFEIDQHLDGIIWDATNGDVSKLSSRLSPSQLTHLKADLKEAIRKEIVEENRKDRDLSPYNPIDTSIVSSKVVARAAQSLATQFESLDRVGKQDASDLSGHDSDRLKPVLNTLKEFEARRLDAKLSSAGGANFQFEQDVMRAMSDRMAAMGNSDLLELYRTSVSADMLELRLALTNRPENRQAQSWLEDLNSLEAAIHMEVAERTAAGDHELEGFAVVDKQLSARQLGVLAEAENRSFKRELSYQSDTYLKGADQNRTEDPQATQRLQGTNLQVSQVVSELRKADLTINIPEHLLEDGGPFIGDQGQVKDDLQLANIHELKGGAKGGPYVDRRTTVENTMFPGLAKPRSAPSNPSDRPLYSAVNVGRGIAGGAARKNYGRVVLVLDDQVKNRATYTPADTFYSYEAHITEDGKRQFQEDLDKLWKSGQLSEQGQKEFDEDHAKQDILNRVDQAIDRHFGLGHEKQFEDFVCNTLIGDRLGSFSKKDQELITNAALRAFIDRSDPKNHVVSQERMGQLLGHVANQDAQKIARTIQDPKRVNTELNRYIEAQVHGGVDLRHDIKEIRVNADACTEAQIDNAEKLAQQLGVPFKPFSLSDAVKKRTDTSFDYANQFPQLPQQAKNVANNLNEFKQNHLPTILDKYKEHEQSFDPMGIHGRRHICRSLIYSNAMANMMRQQGAQIDSHALYTTTAMHDSGRQGNGADIWEKDSAGLTKDYLKQNGLDDDRDEDYLELIDAAIDSQADPDNKTLEGLILKSADSLDIQRVYGRKGYREDKLGFMFQDTHLGGDKYLMVDETQRKALIDEAATLIENTEPFTDTDRDYERVQQEYNDLDPEDKDYDTKAMDLPKRMAELKVKAAQEHKAMNAKLSSAEVFQRIENEVTNNPKRYPLLNKYYKPDAG